MDTFFDILDEILTIKENYSDDLMVDSREELINEKAKLWLSAQVCLIHALISYEIKNPLISQRHNLVYTEFLKKEDCDGI